MISSATTRAAVSGSILALDGPLAGVYSGAMAFCPEILILRHGQTAWNAEQRLQGRLDSPLTETGRAQAQAQNATLLALDLVGFEFRCSPQGRAFATAAIALRDVAMRIETDARLCEIDVGDWSGKRRDALEVDFTATESPDGALEYYQYAPGGEGFAGLRARCESFLGDLTRPTVIVTHGITSRMLRLVALGAGDEMLADLPGGQGVIYRVRDGIHSKV